MNTVQTITGNDPAQVRDVAIAGSIGRHKARVALSPSGEAMFVIADTFKPTSFRKPGPKVWSKGKVKSFCNLRLSGLSRLIKGRHNGPCDTDDGEAYYLAALPHLVAKVWAYGVDDTRIQSAKWASMWTRGLWAEKPAAWFEEQEQGLLLKFENNNGRPSLPSADDFARSLGITHAEVKLYELRTIGAVDRLEKQRIADEREADRIYQAAKRASKGATPREVSITARQPWTAYGISRPTYYRHLALGQLGETVSSGETNSSETNGIVSITPLPDLVPSVVSVCPTADNDDTPDRVAAPALPITETGYVGRNFNLTPVWVQIFLDLHPNLADDLKSHLDAVDALMVKTPEWNWLAVSKNLMRDRSRAVSRARRAANDNTARTEAA